MNATQAGEVERALAGLRLIVARHPAGQRAAAAAEVRALVEDWLRGLRIDTAARQLPAAPEPITGPGGPTRRTAPAGPPVYRQTRPGHFVKY